MEEKDRAAKASLKKIEASLTEIERVMKDQEPEHQLAVAALWMRRQSRILDHEIENERISQFNNRHREAEA